MRAIMAAAAGLLTVWAVTVPGVAQAGGHTVLPDTMPGDRLLVRHITEEGLAELHIVNSDASERTVLTEGHDDRFGAWSPEGRHVAFQRIEGTYNGLYVVTSDGANVTRLADHGYAPSWSPDSRRLVYSTSISSDFGPLRIAGLDGSSTSIPGTSGGQFPVWSPNGAHIAYVSQQADDPEAAEVAVVRPDGSDHRVLGAGLGAQPAWSPDSTHVTFTHHDNGRDQLMLARRDGTQATALAEFPEIQSPTFSPSGRDITIGARQDTSHHIWRIDVADGSAHQLTDSPKQDVVPTRTADSTLIAFTRLDELDPSSPGDAWWVDPSATLPPFQITDTGADHAVEFGPGRSIRLAGTDRVHTAVELSRTFVAADTVVIARAEDYPDALAGGPLAGALDAPVLLTSQSRLAQPASDEIARLGADHAYLLGGETALSPQIERDLAGIGITDTTRLAGPDRFATAAAIAAELVEVAGDAGRVLVVEGAHADPARGWPDAVSAAGLASLTIEPILPVTHDHIPDATRDALAELNPTRALIVGGTGAVSAGVQTQLADAVDTVDRVAGRDRYDTSNKVADLAVGAGAEDTHPWMATGRNWPDALATAPAVGHDGGVFLLVDGRYYDRPDPRSTPGWEWLGARLPERGVVVGGSSVITPKVRTAIESELVSGR